MVRVPHAYLIDVARIDLAKFFVSELENEQRLSGQTKLDLRFRAVEFSQVLFGESAFAVLRDEVAGLP